MQVNRCVYTSVYRPLLFNTLFSIVRAHSEIYTKTMHFFSYRDKCYFGVRLEQLVPQQKQLCILTCIFLISHSMCQLLEMIYINLSILLNVQTSYSSPTQSQLQHKFCRSSNACKFLRLVFDVTQKISVSGKTSDLENAF